MPTDYAAHPPRATVVGTMIGVDLSDSRSSPIERTAHAETVPRQVEPDALLSYCPRCVYDLRTLPVHHHCPECGLEIDRRWEVFGGPLTSPTSRRFGNALKGFVLVWVMIPTTIAIGLTFSILPVRLSLPMHVGLVALIGFLIGMIRRKPRQWVACGPDGVVVYRRPGAMERHSWSAVKKARHDVLRKSVVIELAEGRTRISHFDFCGFAINEADRCTAAINRYLRSTA